MTKILILDNYDSFTYNLVQLVEKVEGVSFEVHRNDQISLKEIERFDKILLSPGPGVPSEAGILLDVIRKFSETKSILGVCLGMQAIGEVFGAKLENLSQAYHGISTPTKIIKQNVLFNNCPKEFSVGRYHSWVVSKDQFPEVLDVTAIDSEGYIMALQHKQFKVCGVQFHPESILSEHGETIMRNWIETKILENIFI